MPKHRLRTWTGPAFVREISARLREAGVNVLVEGTEHVIVEEEGSLADAAAWNVRAALCQKHGRDFGLCFEKF